MVGTTILQTCSWNSIKDCQWFIWLQLSVRWKGNDLSCDLWPPRVSDAFKADCSRIFYLHVMNVMPKFVVLLGAYALFFLSYTKYVKDSAVLICHWSCLVIPLDIVQARNFSGLTKKVASSSEFQHQWALEKRSQWRDFWMIWPYHLWWGWWQ